MARGKVQRAAAEPVDGPWALPDGWRWERLDDVAPVNPRRPLNALADDDEIAFVGMASVEAETGRIDVTNTRNARQVRQGFTRFAPGDVLFAKITPCMENGKVAIVPEIPSGVGVGSTEFHVFGTNGLLPEYLYHWVSQRSFREIAEFHMTGTAGQKRVPPDFLRDCPIPVPDLNIQRRIVAHVAELFAEIDDGEAALDRARGDLATWRKALLKAAVTGELTAEWRAANPPTETGSDLLARILAERRTRWLSEPRNKGKRYVEPKGPDTASLEELPPGWAWASLHQVSERITDGTHQPPGFTDDGVPFIVIQTIRKGRIQWDNVRKFVSQETYQRETSRLRPSRGDVLYTAVGSYGTAVEVCDDRDFMFQRHIAHIRPLRFAITSSYLAMLLN